MNDGTIRTKKELIVIYDGLIQRASMNIGKSVKVEWGNWVPTEVGLNTLMSRRNKLIKGV